MIDGVLRHCRSSSNMTRWSNSKVVGEIARDIERVYGKEQLLVDIAIASIDEPAGRVCDVIFPIVGKDKLAAIIEESQAKGALDRRIYKVMRASWAFRARSDLVDCLDQQIDQGVRELRLS